MALEPKTVLLIESDPADARLIQGMLRESGRTEFELEVADTLSAGLKRSAEGGIDLILLDLGVPGSQGIGTIAYIHQQAPGIPVLVLTKRESDTVALETVRAGAQDYLFKSKLNGEALVRTMRHAMGREQARAALRKSEHRLRNVIETTGDGVLVVDKNGVVRFANPAAEALFSRKTGEFVGELVGFPLVAGEATEVDLVRAEGERGVAEMRVVETEWEEETAYLASLRDITERKQVEEALRGSEERWRSLVENAPDIIMMLNRDGTIESVNHTVPGLTPEEVVGKNVCDYISPEHVQVARDAVEKVFESATPLTYEVRGVGPHGATAHYSTRIGPVQRGGDVVAAIQISTDITERRQLEEQLRQAQKMEAIGRLAGGIAHDFNNLLTIILGFSDIMLKKMGEQDPFHTRVSVIKQTGERAATLVRQLLAFSRRQVLRPQVLNLNDMVSGIEQMLRRVIGEDIDLISVPHPDRGLVEADPGQVEQIIMNLAVNARDAMPDGGKLTIETANVALDEAYASEHADAEPGPHVMLAVSDTGHGMNKETQKQAFEPFFTTKEVGKGTGLGLSTVYGIVRQSGGHIWVYSEPGEGTTFKVYFPMVEKAVNPVETKDTPEKPVEGSETILVVEDEGGVRELVCEALENQCYTVLEAGTPDQALALCNEHEGHIDLLLTDVVLPGMNGRALSDQLRQRRPSLKVTYMSGYTDNATVHRGALEEGTAFIEKPFTPDTLAKKVREVLDATKEDA